MYSITTKTLTHSMYQVSLVVKYTLYLVSFKDRNAAHARKVQKSEPEEELHTPEFLGPLDLFCISKVPYRKKMISIFYEMIIYLKIRC